MTNTGDLTNASYSTQYFPQHVALLTVGENLMPIGHWTVISKDPFRLLMAMEMGNYSFELLKNTGRLAFISSSGKTALRSPGLGTSAAETITKPRN